MPEFARSVGAELYSRRLEGEGDHVALLAEIRRDPSLPTTSRNELASLAHESDPELFAEGLYLWARREEAAERLGGAFRAYEWLTESSLTSSESLRQRVAARVAVLSGGGSFGDRVELLSQRFVREATNPVAILGMASAGVIFTGARAALLARFAASSRPILGARTLASTGAFMVEVPAFWGITKGLNESLAPGSQDWSVSQNLREMGGLALTLGALKISGALATRGVAWAHRSTAWGQATRLSPWAGLSRSLAPQVGMLGGIMLGHRLEVALGLLPATDGATALTDSLALLLQFNVGGRLSQTLLGRNFQAMSRELEIRGRHLPARPRPNFFGPRADGGGEFPILAMAGAYSHEGPLMEQGPSRSFDQIFAMSSIAEGGGAAAAPKLRPRTGRSVDDRFETPMPAGDMLHALRGREVAREIEGRLEGEGREGLSETELGSAVGEALHRRLEGLATYPEFRALRSLAGEPWSLDYTKLPAWESLPAGLREHWDAAAELMQVTQFSLRSNQTELSGAAFSRLPGEAREAYRDLVALTPILKGGRLTLPEGDIARGSEVLGPEEAVLSHGTGDMSSILKAIVRQARPGGRPWYARHFATDADARIVAGIRREGRNPVFTKPVHHNYEHDIPIEAVHNKDPLAMALFRRVRVQFLNVPSTVLDRMLNEEFVRHLPERAVLVSAIGGLLNGGVERPRLPYQFLRERLDSYGRDDVEVVSMAGYIPGDKLWRGEHVEVNLATREDLVRPGNPRSAAPLVAGLLSGTSGPTFQGDFVSATVSHWEHSNNLGKVAKNVFTLMVGYRAGRVAREVVEQQQGLAPQDPRYAEILELGHSRYARARRGVWDMMQGLLVHNEGIKPSRARYTQAVFNDFDSCSQIEFDNLVRVVRRAREFPIREAAPQDIQDFLQRHVFSPERHVASTRNPRRGIAQALYEIWADRGLPFTYEEVGPRVTTEGVDSLGPLLRFYGDRSLDIERRRLPAEIYDLHRAFLGRAVEPPPVVGSHLRRAIERNPEEVETLELQSGLRQAGLTPQRLRSTLEGRGEDALRIFNRELRRLASFAHAEAADNPAGGVFRGEELLRQGELLKSLEQAMLRGDPQRIIRSPVLLGPYENAFIIQRHDRGASALTHQAFLRLRLEAVQSRLTSLGMFLRSFPPHDDLEVEIRIPDASMRATNFRELFEVQKVTREITGAFRRHRSGALRLSLDRRAEEEEWSRPEAPEPAFYESLKPLARWVQGGAGNPGTEEVRALFRRHRHDTSEALDSVLHSGSGWPMLLGPAPGPLQSGIRSMMTRPEKATLLGIYSGDRLVDTFAVFRHGPREGRVLSHQLLRRFSQTLPDRPEYRTLTALDYFSGMPVEGFIRNYQAYADRQGITVEGVRPLAIRYAPVEQALVGNLPELNAGLLKLFLLQESSASRELLHRATPLYETDPEVAQGRFVDLAKPYLERYEAEHRQELAAHPLVELFKRFRHFRAAR